MDDDLIGKAAVVTGASRGIGHAAARCLSKLGVNVVLTARTQDAADTAAATVRGAVGFAAHAADVDAARRCVDFTLERFGRLDILVNNAATNAAYGPLVDQHYDAFRKTIDLNVWAPIVWSSLAAWLKISSSVVYIRKVMRFSSSGGSIEPEGRFRIVR